MKGWKEEEFKNTDLMAPCGLYCGLCGVYIATRDNNEKFKKVMGNLYGTPPEETGCLGCMQPDPPKQLYGFAFGGVPRYDHERRKRLAHLKFGFLAGGPGQGHNPERRRDVRRE